MYVTKVTFLGFLFLSIRVTVALEYSHRDVKIRRRKVHLIVTQDVPSCREDKGRLKQALETVSIVGAKGDSTWEVVAILCFPHRLQPNSSNRLYFGIGSPGEYQDQAHLEPMFEVRRALMVANGRFLLRPEIIDQVLAAANAWLAELPIIQH
jgi:hypothetical protein